MIAQARWTGDRSVDYPLCLHQMEQLLADDNDLVSIMANACALLSSALNRISWLGLYRWIDSENCLRLSACSGLPARAKLSIGKGLSGLCIERGETLALEDLPLHQQGEANDERSVCALVIPLIKSEVGLRLGTLQVESTHPHRFDPIDQVWLEQCAQRIAAWKPSS